jgi:glucose/mannose-6-phosphate isomerase
MDATISLDRTSDLLAIDTSNMLQSIRDFPDQLASGWSSMAQVTVPTHYVQAANIVILGVGTGAVAGQYVERMAMQSSSVPVSVCQSDRLPGYVNGRTLVIALSYSGQTPDVVAAFREAGQRGCKLFGISTGGEIGVLCRKYRSPWYQIQYGSQSRAALGYLFAPLIEIMQRLGFLDKHAVAFEQSLTVLREYIKRLETAVPSSQNPAKQIAQSLVNKQLYLIASELFLPVARRWTSQIVQNAKHIAWNESISEVQHATLERFGAFGGTESTLKIINFRSSHDSESDALALNAAEQLLALVKVLSEELLLSDEGTLFQDLLLYTTLGDYVSWYLAIIKQVDPTATPLIDEFRERRSGYYNHL